MGAMVTTLKIGGLALGLLGLLVTLLDALGKFRDQERLDFARLLRESTQGLPRSTPGFDKFLSAFPAPAGIDASAIISTAKDVLRTLPVPDKHHRPLRCERARTAPVATYAEVVAWSEKTRQKWWSLSISAVGWAIWRQHLPSRHQRPPTDTSEYFEGASPPTQRTSRPSGGHY